MGKEGIRIFGRIRPSKRQYKGISFEKKADGSVLTVKVPSKGEAEARDIINHKKDQFKFKFDKIFPPETTQEEVFEEVAMPLANSALQGYNATIFAYGQTGSGKTFTITGGAERYEDRGIIPRTLSYLFRAYEKDPDTEYSTAVSYLEIYNEHGYDLIYDTSSIKELEDLPKVQIMEDVNGQVALKNLSKQNVTSEEEALNVLFLGDTNRMIAETPMNMASTRSHCIFTIYITSRQPGSAVVKRSKLHLVDLAGSERVKKSGVEGVLLQEAKYINLSLHYLEQVIVALSEKGRSHIPYRNSMMTSVLRDSLGGNSLTSMIATMSSDSSNVDESISTCRFAQRVAMVQNDATMNEETDPHVVIARLKKEIQQLREQLALVNKEQSTEPLGDERQAQCRDRVERFIADPDATLEADGDMRIINEYFAIFRFICRGLPVNSQGEASTGASLSAETTDKYEQELERLRALLKHRDKEMRILHSKLQYERGKNSRPDSSVASEPTSRRASSVAASSSSTSSSRSTSAHRSKRAHLSRDDAFTQFKASYPDMPTIERNKSELKQLYHRAKSLGKSITARKDAMARIKASLAQLLEEKLPDQVAGRLSEAEVDADDARLREQLDAERRAYTAELEELRQLKGEIEHLQHLLTNAKTRLERDFEEWWERRPSQDS